MKAEDFYPKLNQDRALTVKQAQWILEMGREQPFDSLERTKQEERQKQITAILRQEGEAVQDAKAKLYKKTPTEIPRRSRKQNSQAEDDSTFQTATEFHAAVQVLLGKWRIQGTWTHIVTLRYRLGPPKQGTPLVLSVTSALPSKEWDQFKWLISQILIEVKDQVWLCARGGCPNVFIRHHKQTYCSPRCAGLERIRRFRHRKAKEFNS